MSGLTLLESSVCPILRDDIDTDQIIPARFLKATTKEGIGEGLFADWAKEPGFPTKDARFAGSQIVLAGRNFGCGSSREHAAWALAQNGFRVVIARSFADIFRQNALKNGILPLALGDSDHADLAAYVEQHHEAVVRVDLTLGKMTFGDRSVLFQVEPFARQCLIEGVDELGYILARMHLVQAYEATFES